MFIDEFTRAWEQLLGRAGGPLYIRLLIQPTIAIILAIRAGLRDARENKPSFLWELVTNRAQRKVVLKTVWQDIGRVLIAAFLIDSIYQIAVFKTFYLLQALIVTFILALLPYIILRVLTRLWRRFRRF